MNRQIEIKEWTDNNTYKEQKAKNEQRTQQRRNKKVQQRMNRKIQRRNRNTTKRVQQTQQRMGREHK